jgi:pimeloyl-ACP methyl ester carboxylesterase
VKETAGIRFAEAGQGMPPLLFLHGIGGDTESFRPQLDGLSAKRRVIAWNMPGYGGSQPLADMTFGALANRLADFLDGLGIDSLHLAGQSIGGMIAIEFALRYPHRVKSLVLIATTSAFGGRDDSFRTEFLKARLAPLENGRTMPELTEEFVPQIVGPKAGPEAVASAVGSMGRVKPDSYRQVIACLVTFDRRDDIGHLSCPVCLIAGSQDSNAPARTMERMAGKIAGSEFHVVEGAGHLVNLEAPDETNAIIENFLSVRCEND